MSAQASRACIGRYLYKMQTQATHKQQVIAVINY